jgi:hypothetical protein
MSFKKLALVTAMFAATSGAYAMEAMDDESMAAATGQDGITIGITTNALTLDQRIHDRDGYDPTNAVADTIGGIEDGALIIDNMIVNTNGGEIVLKIDADGGAAGTAPFLNVNVSIPNNTVIQTGDISVASSDNVADANGGVGTWAISNQTGTIMDSQTITLGSTALNIQLGNEAQTYSWGAGTKTAMILVSTTMTGGLTVGTVAAGVYSGGVTLNDGSSGESISIGRMRLRDNAGTDLTVGSVGINVENNGLVVDIASIGTGGLYQSMERVALGDVGVAGNGYLGDIEVLGLDLNGTSIRISGH